MLNKQLFGKSFTAERLVKAFALCILFTRHYTEGVLMIFNYDRAKQ